MDAAKKGTMKLIIAFLTEALQVFQDCAKVFESTPLDPHRFAETPPDGWHKATPTAQVPERKVKQEEISFEVYTLAEIEAMTPQEYAVKVGCMGLGTQQDLIKALTKKERKKAVKGNAIEL